MKYIKKYNSYILIHNKIFDALRFVKTTFCVLCADDDFITSKGINKCVGFLEKNSDFSCCLGNYISFYIKNKNKFYWKYSYRYRSITSPDVKNRLNQHFKYYFPTFYAVYRTRLLKILFEEAAKYTNDFRFNELLASMLTLIYGKMKMLNIIYSARETLELSTTSKYNKLTDYIKKRTYDFKYKKFRNRLAAHLSKNSNFNINESKRIIDKGMSIYIREKLYVNWSSLIMNKIKSLMDKLGLPRRIDERLRTIYRKLFLPKLNQEIPVSKYYLDLNIIRNHVISKSMK